MIARKTEEIFFHFKQSSCTLDDKSFQIVGLYLSIREDILPIDKSNNPNPPLNGPIYVEYNVLQHVFTSTAEAETAGLFYNFQSSVDINPLSLLIRTTNNKQIQYIFE